jgi:hypothetical protein
MRRLNEEQLAELHRLHVETVAVVTWLAKHQGFRYGGSIRTLVDEALEKQRLGKMRAVARELRGMIGSLPASLRQQILDGLGATALRWPRISRLTLTLHVPSWRVAE